MRSYIWRVAYFAPHATCPITLMGVKIQHQLQMVIAIQKLSCKPNCKTPLIFIMSIRDMFICIEIFEILSTRDAFICIKNMIMSQAMLQRSWPSPSIMKTFYKLLMIMSCLFPKQIFNFANYLNLKQCQGIIENPRMKGVRGTSLCHFVKIMKGATT